MKALKIVGIVLASIVVILGIFIAVLATKSPGKVDSITEKTFIKIGDEEQGFFLRSENLKNPVILFLHGGPGSPELPFLLPYETKNRLERDFTVCYWDQRGAGMSYDKSIHDIPTDSLIARYVEDTREMTLYLCNRFETDKIILMGHSWGSYLGVKTIQKYPELYRAYIGIGQVVNQRNSETQGYHELCVRASKNGDRRALKKLHKFTPIAPDFPSYEYLVGVRSPLMDKYGIGMMHKPVKMSKVARDILSFRGYTLGEKCKYLRGIAFAGKTAFHLLFDENFFVSATRFEVPVYIIHGVHDYQVSYTLARRWFDRIQAPKKAFYAFERSAHSPNIEESDRFVRLVNYIGRNN